MQCELIPEPALVSIVDGVPSASSLIVAQSFSKPHDKVCRDIRNLCERLPEAFRAANFGETFYEASGPNGATRKLPMYLLSRDGFSLLVMGFTGEKAIAWKLRYIEAFNAMEAKLEADKAARRRRALRGPKVPDKSAEIRLVYARFRDVLDDFTRQMEQFPYALHPATEPLVQAAKMRLSGGAKIAGYDPVAFQLFGPDTGLMDRLRGLRSELDRGERYFLALNEQLQA